MKINLVDVAKVVPYGRNPRKNEAAVAKVAASIREFGFRQPIVVDTAMVVIAGHTRLLAAKQLGLTQVPVHVAHELTPAQVRAYRLADNRTSEESAWDFDLLRLELSELESQGVDLALTSFDTGQLAQLLGTAPVRKEVSDKETQTQYNVLIRCADEREQVRLLERFVKEGLECRALQG